MTVLLLPLLAAGQSADTSDAQSPPAERSFPCEKPAEFHQFDFWIGEWEVKEGDQIAGRNSISVREHGCVLLEEWKGANGSTGMSINYYDPAKREWLQVWVSGGGYRVEIAGGLREGSMVLEGEAYYYANARRTLFRGTWTPLPDGRVRQYFDESSDGGETWEPWFEGYYARTTASSGVAEASLPPGYTTARTGDVRDFDYFAGGWTTHQRRLKTRGVGSDEWEEFPATLCMTPYLGGMTTVDELVFPTKGWAGLTVRAFDAVKRQWSIYWVSSATGRMDPPVVGGFDGDHGEFYGEDVDDGRPVKVRYTWNKLDRDHARWEQAFSYDGRAWETNWTADFTRADTATTCEGGRPRRSSS